MKKITVILLALMAFSRPAFSQATISVDAPRYDGYWSALLGPNGFTSATTSYQYNRACYLIPQSELTRMIATNSVITDFGFDFYRPGNVNVAGNFTLYLQNTSDATYNKGTTFANITTGMTTHYSSAMTLTSAATQVTAAVTIPLSSSFTYTGGGVYVAWEWVASAATSTTFNRYLGTSDGTTVYGAVESAPVGGSLPATLTNTTACPAMRFKATNTATNEVSVVDVIAPGAVTKLNSPGHKVTALIRNNSVGTLNNIPVTLTATGANPYTLTSTITALAAGATINVQFTPPAPTANGTSSLNVTVPADQYTVNNVTPLASYVGIAQTQSASCSDYSNAWLLGAANFIDGNYGFGAAAMLVTPHEAATTSSITEIKFVPSGAVSICGVLLDANGQLLASTNTLLSTQVTPSVYTSNLKFNPPYELTANTKYYYGIAQQAAGFVFATQDPILATTNLNLYYSAPFTGNGPIGGAQNQMGYVGMQAILTYSNLAITASVSPALVCKNDGSTVTLTSGGAAMTTYTWSRVPTGLIGNTSTAVATPSVTGNQTLVSYQVIGTDGPTGCRTNTAVVSVTVSACTALSSNSSDGYEVNLYPNPSANGKSTISGLVGKNNILIYNTMGQVVYTKNTSDESVELDLSGLAPGNYIVKITSETNQIRMVKLMN